MEKIIFTILDAAVTQIANSIFHKYRIRTTTTANKAIILRDIFIKDKVIIAEIDAVCNKEISAVVRSNIIRTDYVVSEFIETINEDTGKKIIKHYNEYTKQYKYTPEMSKILRDANTIQGISDKPNSAKPKPKRTRIITDAYK